MSDSSISAACQSLCGSSSLHFSYENCCILAQHLFLTPVLYDWNSCDSRGDQLHLCSFAHDTSLFNRLQVTDLYSTGYNLECEVSHLTGEATNSQFISCCSLYIILAQNKPSHWYASHHYSVPVPSQENWEGCGRKGIWRKNGGIVEVGALIVHMGWRPDRLSVHLPMLSFPAP